MTRPAESAEVREQIARALRLDLIGPWAGHALSDERLRGWERPSNWYLTGFLVPRGAPVEQRGDADVDDEPEVAERAGLGDDSTEDRRAAKKGFFPSSMGLSFLVSEGVGALEVLVRWGDYRRVEAESGDPNRDRAEQGGEAGVGRDNRETPADQRASGDGAGDGTGVEGRDDAKAGTGLDATSQSQVQSWWQRTPRAEPVEVVLPATDDRRPATPPGSEFRRADPPRGRASGGCRDLRGADRARNPFRVPVPGERPRPIPGSRARRGVRLSGRDRGAERGSVRPAPRPPRGLRR